MVAGEPCVSPLGPSQNKKCTCMRAAPAAATHVQQLQAVQRVWLQAQQPLGAAHVAQVQLLHQAQHLCRAREKGEAQ